MHASTHHTPYPWTTALGRELRERRIALSLTQAEVGHLAGVSGSTIGKAERGETLAYDSRAKLHAYLREEHTDDARALAMADALEPVNDDADGALDTIEFMGVAIPVDTERELVVLKPLCEAVGLSWRGQQERLERASWACTRVIRVQLPGDVQGRDVTMLPRKQVPMWIATVDATRLRNDDAREWVEAFQRECVDVLDRHWNRGAGAAPERRQPIARMPQPLDVPALVAAVGATLGPILARSDRMFAQLIGRMDSHHSDTEEDLERVESRVATVESNVVELRQFLPAKRARGEVFLSEIAGDLALTSRAGKPHWQLVRAVMDSVGALERSTASRLVLDDNGKEITRRVVLAECVASTKTLVASSVPSTRPGEFDEVCIGGTTFTYAMPRADAVGAG